MDPATTTSRDAALDALDRALEQWSSTDSFQRAVTETVGRHGYAPDDVIDQLTHVALRCRGRTMRYVLQAELGEDAVPANAPSNVLVLASGRMPGLAIEGIAAAISLGATALVRPSRDETVLHHFLGLLREDEPELAGRIDVVGTGEEPPWDRADAAVVFGSDETIALVRDKLPAAAKDRVAAYGSRQGIAVVAPGADVDASWAKRLAGDVLAFRQVGCMSPSWLFVLGDDEAAARLQESVGRELAMARDKHVADGVDVGMQQRRSSDADVLGAIAAGMAPNATALHAGDAQLTVVRVSSEDELVAQVGQLGTLLQTAVIATSREDRGRIAELLLERTNVTRICLPGQAHEPDGLWPQDGIGRVAPLVGRIAGS
ncbi:MAG: hypothetical protein JWL76_1107 [Thermoleophilia bacterium]|nr:hypothetical protein [Thermoleophilia bacterium]